MLFSHRHLLREHLGGEQPFHEVVVPDVAVAPCEADHARDRVRLEHRAHDVLRHPEPVLRRTGLARNRSMTTGPRRGSVRARARPPRRSRRGSRRGTDAPCGRAQTEPGELARQDERQCLVGRFEDLTAFVELVTPGRLVAGDARVQHEVVAPAGDRDRIELDRPEPPEDLEHPLEASREDRAGARKCRATRNRRAASAVTFTRKTLARRRPPTLTGARTSCWRSRMSPRTRPPEADLD